MKKLTYIILLSLVILFPSCQVTSISPSPESVSIPVAGNTYVTAGKNGAVVSPKGIETWTGTDAVLSSWFKVSHPGELKLFLKAKASDGSSTIRLKAENKDFSVRIDKPEETIVPVGSITITNPGYIRVDMQGVKKEGGQFASISELVIDGPAAAEPLYFTHDFEAYWALRGPSVHMKYTLPEENAEYFYNEVTVPEGEDKIGSYFMTNGFGEGYCGIQANSETERRILFSVWSPFSTDNPKDIPENQRIKLLAKGKDVHIGEFGNEGSGGQSYLIYPWKAGETYRVITRVHPDGKGNTEYYAWFFSPDEKEWRLIAGFLRPQTNTWYKGAHSFLENFIPGQGYLERSVRFGNQWVRTDRGEWKELTEGTFTYDATANAKVRMDYAGGVEGNCFFLKNGGFFNENTKFQSVFKRPQTGKTPDVDVKKLPL
ncbi:DUF3472 domain-containing protein [Parabacteroides sp. AM08-6]|uniref:DUF3472 domain-containing protein n=1 Tax=Parabacteroides sp. AM08-6 TaxID=2292053 RepID=UPI000EFEFB55|nr:DUF3472 domain-containing protein [Parabacteroides sp. AM08-6]RHJ85310.1 DUF3472 domain-containing protein [Parabacteroides sp. AM08-6]